MILKNPMLKENKKSRDPFITIWNGKYYSCYGSKDTVTVREFSSLEQIEDAKEIKVYVAGEGMPISWYAPEMHLIDGHWYIYGAPSMPGDGLHSMHVLRSISEDPTSNYEYMGPLGGLEGRWSIDGTPFMHEGKWYMVVAMSELYICEMRDPMNLKGEPKFLTKSEYPWEMVKAPIVEGPAVLRKNDKLHIVYSASDCVCDDYCLGLLTWNGGDILDCNNWTKQATPIFKSANGLYGPGHCSFTTCGDKDVIVYHANPEREMGPSGSLLCLQSFVWENDYPVLGEPQREVFL